MHFWRNVAFLSLFFFFSYELKKKWKMKKGGGLQEIRITPPFHPELHHLEFSFNLMPFNKNKSTKNIYFKWGKQSLNKHYILMTPTPLSTKQVL